MSVGLKGSRASWQGHWQGHRPAAAHAGSSTGTHRLRATTWDQQPKAQPAQHTRLLYDLLGLQPGPLADSTRLSRCVGGKGIRARGCTPFRSCAISCPRARPRGLMAHRCSSPRQPSTSATTQPLAHSPCSTLAGASPAAGSTHTTPPTMFCTQAIPQSAGGPAPGCGPLPAGSTALPGVSSFAGTSTHNC